MSHPASRRVAVLALALAATLATPLASSTTYSFRVGSQGLQGGPAPQTAPAAQAINIAGGYAVNLRTAALAAGWDGTKPLVATVTANIGSTATTSPGLTISGSFPNGVTLVINAGVYVVGAGGSAGGTTGQGTGNGGNGGTAISAATPVTITNNGVIGGGGGGGAGYTYDCRGGGGAGRSPGSGWESGTLTNGGRNGAGQLGGAPGETGNYQFSSYCNGQGGSGGGLGAAGGRGTLGQPGAGGAAVVGNTNVTWATAGTRYGALN